MFTKSIMFILTVFLCITVTNGTWAGNIKAEHSKGELIVQLKADVPDCKIKNMFAAHGATVTGEISQIGVKLIKVPDHTLETVKATLKKNTNVESVEYNFFAEPHMEPNDPGYSSQWYLSKISAPAGWDINQGSVNIPIAIIDSGVDADHPDLAAKLVTGYNFVNNNTNTDDVYGHGTAVAGTAAAITNNFIGIAGTACESTIMPLLTLGSDGWATYYNVARAVTFAADNNVRVINISLGGSSSSITMQNAINYAWNKGVIIIASAGNNNSSAPVYPAACDNVVSVSATTSSDTRSSFSSYGNTIDVSAPGSYIYTTRWYGGYGYWNGTSFSSPIVAGLAALVLSVNPDLTNAQVVNLIEQNADDLGTEGYDIYFGHGRVNVYNTLIATSGEIPDPDVTDPSAVITSPENGSTVNGLITVTVNATDDVGVADVELHVDGALFGTDTTTPYSFGLNTNNLVDGDHTLTAFAYDTSGNVGSSETVVVCVSNQPVEDTTPPTVLITAPTDDAIVSKMVKIVATASDDVDVVRIELIIDTITKLDREVSSIKYPWNVRKVSAGPHVIIVNAYDAAGNIGTDTITVSK